MTAANSRSGSGWTLRLLTGLILLLIGAAASVWGLAHYPPAARFLGIVPAPEKAALVRTPAPLPAVEPVTAPSPAAADSRLAMLESRLARVENAAQRAEGSAGRADALVVAFAARRAIDRGVALGYLENLLVARFGQDHRQAVATIVTAARQPVRLGELGDLYDRLGPQLRAGGARDSWLSNLKYELGSLIEVHRSEQPGSNVNARYNRARQHLQSGEVEQALAETMRLPGAGQAADWTQKARRYIAAHRALDEIESAALLNAAQSGR